MERSDLGTVSLIFIKFLILKEENTNLMLRFLQYRLTKVRTLRWAKLDMVVYAGRNTRYGSLKYRVQISSGGFESLHGVLELISLLRYVLIALFISYFLYYRVKTLTSNFPSLT